MGFGIFLVTLGAFLTFALRSDSSWVDLRLTGVILMLAGGATIYLARRGRTKVREVTRVESDADPSAPSHSVTEKVVEQESD